MEKEELHQLQPIPPDARITFISHRISLMDVTFFPGICIAPCARGGDFE
jgi:hypothetical protein